MKKEELIALGIDEESAKKVMEINGADIQNVAAKLKTAESDRDGLKAQLESAQASLKTFEGIDPQNLQAEIVKAQDALKTAQETHKAELTARDSRAETDRFLAGQKFINDITRDFYAGEVEKQLSDPANRGKSRQDIFTALTKDEKGQPKPGVFAEESPNKLLDLPPSGAVPVGTDPVTGNPTNNFMNALIRGAKGEQ